MSVEYIEKKGTESLKWDYLWKEHGSEDLLPLCTAEMDFDVPDFVRTAAADFAMNSRMGLSGAAEQYYESFIAVWKEKHQADIRPEWIRRASSVQAAVSRVILMATAPEQSVMVLTPETPVLTEPVLRNGRRLITSDLVRSDKGKYLIDFRRMSKDIEENDVKLMLVSAPHDPCGRVWTAYEMINLMEICSAHGVPVVWDETLADFLPGPGRHMSAVSLSDYSQNVISISCPAASFGLCGVQDAVVVIPNDEFRARYTDIADRLGDRPGSTLDMAVLKAALDKGSEWTDELCDIIGENYEYLKTALEEVPGLVVSPLEGGYYLWADFSSVCETASLLRNFFEEQCRLAPDYGTAFGGQRFGGFVRFNLATDRSNIIEAAERIRRALDREE